MEIAAPDGTLSVLGVAAQEAYVLCASISDQGLTTTSERGTYIRVLDTVAFAAAVARQIPGCVGGVEGPCRYSTDTVVRKSGARSIQPPKDFADVDSWFHEQNAYVGEQSVDALFLKDAKFAHEAEYRFIWFAEGTRRDFLDICCPAAVRFCERG